MGTAMFAVVVGVVVLNLVLATLRKERIRLAVFASALATIVPAALSRLAAGHPGIDLLLAEAEPPEAMRMLRAGQVDVALVSQHTQNGTPVGPPAAAEGARTRLILDEQVHLVTRPRHRGTRRPRN